jgi:hypothetical protein
MATAGIENDVVMVGGTYQTLGKLFCFIINYSEQALPPLGITRINRLFCKPSGAGKKKREERARKKLKRYSPFEGTHMCTI